MLDRQEAEEDEAAAVLNGGVVPGSAEEYALEEVTLCSSSRCDFSAAHGLH